MAIATIYKDYKSGFSSQDGDGVSSSVVGKNSTYKQEWEIYEPSFDDELDVEPTVLNSDGVLFEDFRQQVADISYSWSKDNALKSKASGAISSPMRGGRYGDDNDKEFQIFDFGFSNDELEASAKDHFNGDIDACKLAIKERVGKWANNIHTSTIAAKYPDKQPKRLGFVQDWHEDTNTPHLRVAVSRVLWLSKTETAPLAYKNRSELDEDTAALNGYLSDIGLALHEHVSDEPNLSKNKSHIPTKATPEQVQVRENAVDQALSQVMDKEDVVYHQVNKTVLVQSFEETQREIERLQREADKFQQAINAVDNEALVRAQLQNAEHELSQLGIHHERLQEEHSNLTNSYSSLEANKTEIEQALTAEQTQKNQLSESLTELKSEYDRLDEEATGYANEVEQLTEKVIPDLQLKSSKLSNALKNKEDELTRERQENEQLGNDVSKLESDLKRVREVELPQIVESAVNKATDKQAQELTEAFEADKASSIEEAVKAALEAQQAQFDSKLQSALATQKADLHTEHRESLNTELEAQRKQLETMHNQQMALKDQQTKMLESSLSTMQSTMTAMQKQIEQLAANQERLTASTPDQGEVAKSKGKKISSSKEQKSEEPQQGSWMENLVAQVSELSTDSLGGQGQTPVKKQAVFDHLKEKFGKDSVKVESIGDDHVFKIHDKNLQSSPPAIASMLVEKDEISCRNIKPQEAAQLMLDAAVASGWNNINLRGSDEFIDAFKAIVEANPDCGIGTVNAQKGDQQLPNVEKRNKPKPS
ncbi:hypothetical protein BCU68_16455 [Vibrio sp. 10N.286.49.B3]|uniref:hypothetical protein n=1 Tax=Vibrio sp. 10N.286.49.B3 TaxID=1880855 RepID=UPI000C853184|nr:hypothetical protein [Vibrio sp. 10N.286.49.B3]PMH40139.1 hypothetical protein BCU68_16455 [Vibrio sp. 10N.286.49.B3]